MKEKYESLSLAVLKELAKARGMKGLSGMKKNEVIEAMLRQDEKEKPVQEESAGGQKETERNAEEISEKEAEKATEKVSGRAPEGAAEKAPVRIQERAAERTSVRAAEAAAPERSSEGTGRRAGFQGNNNAGGQRPRFKKRPMSEYVHRTADAVSEAGRGAHEANRNENGYRNPSHTGSPASQDGAETEQRAERSTGEYGQRTERSGGEYVQRMERSGGEYVQRMERSGGEYVQRMERSGGEYVQRPDRPSGEYGQRTEHPAGEYVQRPDRPSAELAQLDSGQIATGILEVMADGFGFIRSDNYMPGENDVYVSPSQIRRFNLKTGDIISGNTRIKTMQEKFSALLYLKTINGRTPAEAARRYNFEDMTPIFPNERLRMERGAGSIAMRIVDLISPIGKGQRGMIVSPPKAGKTTLLKDVARSILKNDPDMKLIILLIDERPEEVTDIKEAIQGENVEVIYSTFDELPDHHRRVSEMVIERAKRLVEHQENVTILLDSITRLARAYNLTVPPSGRTLSGGLDPAALHMPKRFFGAARNMREGGSLTILATALVDTGSKMDDVVYEEFKGTGNMELVLDRKLSEKRVFPALDIQKSGTRREDLLLDREEQEAVYIMRRALNGMKSDEAVENILNTFVHTKDNRELVQRVRRQRYV